MVNDTIIYMEMLVVAMSFFFIIISLMIPVYGYIRKRWKGFFIGLLLMPIIAGIVVFVVTVCSIGYIERGIIQDSREAMVSLQGVDVARQRNDTLEWYLRDDDICMYRKQGDETKDAFLYYDVIRLDSASIGVEDRIVVKFDLKKRKVTATDMDKPMKVVKVDWEKVNSYFGR